MLAARICAGVVRAIELVERALALYGPPVYVRHEIVHNRYVVESLRSQGRDFRRGTRRGSRHRRAGDLFRPWRAAQRSGGGRAAQLFALDATCPLVTKVHREAEIHHRRGREIVLIGHAGHPEVIGTMGQLPAGAVTLVETRGRCRQFRAARCRQPRLCDADHAVGARTPPRSSTLLKRRFPGIVGPHKEDICYATTNRQEAVKRVAPMVDAMIVVGSPNSSNSQRLKEVAERAGCPHAVLVQRAADIDWSAVRQPSRRLGITAGASAPEVLVEEIIDAFAQRYAVSIETVSAAEEGMFFPLPRPLREHQAAE